MELARSTRPLRLRARHFHLTSTTAGGSFCDRDEIFATWQEAVAAARERAEGLAATTGLRLLALTDPECFLLTSGRPNEAGRMIEVEECECIAGETGFPPSPLLAEFRLESLGSSSSNGRSESGLSSPV